MLALIALSQEGKVRAPDAGGSRDQEGPGGQDTLMEQLPTDSAPLTPISSSLAFLVSRVVGIGGSLQASWMGEVREGKEKMRLPPTIPFPHPQNPCLPSY